MDIVSKFGWIIDFGRASASNSQHYKYGYIMRILFWFMLTTGGTDSNFKLILEVAIHQNASNN